MTPSVTQNEIFTRLKTFLEAVLPAGTVAYQADNNRVPEPKDANFVVMSATLRGRLQTESTETWSPDATAPTAIVATMPTQFGVQLDIHGPDSADNAQVLATVWRTTYCVDAFPASLKPLTCSDPTYAPFQNGEDQIEWRWVVTVFLQGNPSVSTPMQFADTLAITIAESGA